MYMQVPSYGVQGLWGPLPLTLYKTHPPWQARRQVRGTNREERKLNHNHASNVTVYVKNAKKYKDKLLELSEFNKTMRQGKYAEFK